VFGISALLINLAVYARLWSRRHTQPGTDTERKAR
jgi:hypothetical protein